MFSGRAELQRETCSAFGRAARSSPRAGGPKKFNSPSSPIHGPETPPHRSVRNSPTRSCRLSDCRPVRPRHTVQVQRGVTKAGTRRSRIMCIAGPAACCWCCLAVTIDYLLFLSPERWSSRQPLGEEDPPLLARSLPAVELLLALLAVDLK